MRYTTHGIAKEGETLQSCQDEKYVNILFFFIAPPFFFGGGGIRVQIGHGRFTKQISYRLLFTTSGPENTASNFLAKLDWV